MGIVFTLRDEYPSLNGRTLQMRQDWDRFWSKLDGNKTILGRFLRFYRIEIIARAVNYYLDKHFSSGGIYVECGSGTSETTLKTRKLNRRFVALDYSGLVLETTAANPKIDDCVNADMFFLPFKDGSIDGIWNVGVMEHYSSQDIETVLKEYRRVLKIGAKLVLFWPMTYSSHEIFLGAVELASRVFFNKDFSLYPDEITKLKSPMQGRNFLKETHYRNIDFFFNPRDLMSFGVIVAEK